MSNIRRRKTIRTSLRNAWDRVIRPFGKTAVLLSTIAALNGCAGESIMPAGDAGLQRDQIARLDSFPATDKTPTPDGLVEDKCKTGELECSPYADCVDDACITKKQFAGLCSQSNLIQLTPFYKSGPNTTSSFADMKEGECVRYPSKNHIYTVYRHTDTNQSDLNLIVFDENGLDYSHGIGSSKYMRIGDDAVLFYGGVVDAVQRIYLRLTIPVDDVEVRLTGCDGVGDAAARAEFISNTKKYLKAMEKALGINIGECFTTLHYIMDPQVCCASASSWAESGMVMIGKGLLESVFSLQTKLEEHEPQHILRFCLNNYLDFEVHHLFAFETSEQLLRAYGNTQLADNYAESVAYWAGEIDKDPSIIDTEKGMHGGCSGMGTYLLSKEYLSLSAIGKRDFVRKFHMSLRNDRRLLTTPSDKSAVIGIICNMVSDPFCTKKMSKYCSP